MLITGTGFFGADRTEIKALTDQLGAQYSGELVRGATTVLIVPDSWLSEGELSEKCRKAIHWGSPPVVRRQWLLDSASAGSALPYDAYMVIAAHEAANEEPNLSSGQHCGPVSCSTNPMLLDTEPELITARVCRCSPAGPDSALASARHATPTPVAPHAQNQPAADGVVSGNVVNNKQDSRSAKAQSSLEPERRRAVAHSAAADAFGLDDLQPLHSPGTTPPAGPKPNPHPGTGPAEPAASCPTTERRARSDVSRPREAVDGKSVVLCQVGRAVRPPPGNSVKLFHNLRNLGGVQFHETLQVTVEGQEFDCSCRGGSRGVLLHTGDTADGEHVLSYAEVSAIYVLRCGEVWIEHSYLYDEEDVRNDSRGKGAEYLASHPMQPHELVRGSGAYHSRASAIEGSCEVFASSEARGAAAAAEGESDDCPLLYCASAWDPSTGQSLTGTQSARAGRKRSSVAAQRVSKLRRNC